MNLMFVDAVLLGVAGFAVVVEVAAVALVRARCFVVEER